MFILTWPIDLANAGLMPFQVPFAVYILVGYGFVIASVTMTWITEGKGAVITLLKRFLIWRVGWKWYLAAFLIIPTINLTAVYLNAFITQTPVDYSTAYAYKIFGPSVNLILIIVPFFIFDALTNGEEIGWRGYVLPRLQAKHSALLSSLFIGVIWSAWHIPKYLTHWNTAAFAWFVVDTTAKAVLLTWLYNNTNGSLLLATLFHASGNTSAVLLPLANTVTGANLNATVIASLLSVLTALSIIMMEGSGNLAPSPISFYRKEGKQQ